MTYLFEKSKIGSFTIHKTTARLDCIHKKKFISTGISPKTQATLNLYAGKFKFSIPEIGFHQEMLPGHSNLDLLLAEFPKDSICEEIPLVDNAVRYCIAPEKGIKWQRYILDVTADTKLKSNSLVYSLSENIYINGILSQKHVPVSGHTVSGFGRAIVAEVL